MIQGARTPVDEQQDRPLVRSDRLDCDLTRVPFTVDGRATNHFRPGLLDGLETYFAPRRVRQRETLLLSPSSDLCLRKRLGHRYVAEWHQLLRVDPHH